MDVLPHETAQAMGQAQDQGQGDVREDAAVGGGGGEEEIYQTVC